MESTLVMIKPNAVAAGLIGRIIERYESLRLSVSGIKIKQWTREDTEGFYAEHVGRDFFDGLSDFMISGPVVALVLTGENAISVVRHVNGATDPDNAEPGTIRYSFAKTMRGNIVHSSDSVESAQREIAFWFDSSELVQYNNPDFRI